MARKKDERLVKQAYKEERKAKAAQKKAEAGESYLQPNDDHFVSFKRQLATMGLMLRDIPGDGNCLFRALNDQLEGHNRNHLNLRRDTVRFMIEHREDFEPFVEDDIPFQTHVRQLSQSGTYGGHDALVAFARMREVNIVIHQLNSPLWRIEGGPNGCVELHLSYHNGEHYSSVRRAGDTGETAANNATPEAVVGTSSMNVQHNQGFQRPWRPNQCDDNVDDYQTVSVQRISERTGFKELSLISDALVDYDGDEEAVCDYITSLIMATDSAIGDVDGLDELDVAAKATAASAITNCQVENSSIERRSVAKAKGAPAKLSMRPYFQKLTNKQRKEQNRREKSTRAGTTPADDPKSPSNDANDDALVVEAAFGCLRI